MRQILIIRNFSGEILKKINLEVNRTYTLGSDADSDIGIEGTKIQGKHLQIKVLEDRVLVISLAVNGVKIVSLLDGSEIIHARDGERAIYPEKLQKIQLGDSLFMHVERVPERSKKTVMLSTMLEKEHTGVVPGWNSPQRGKTINPKIWS